MGERIGRRTNPDQTGGLGHLATMAAESAGAAMAKATPGSLRKGPPARPNGFLGHDLGIAEGWARKHPESVWTPLSTP